MEYVPSQERRRPKLQVVRAVDVPLAKSCAFRRDNREVDGRGAALHRSGT